MLNSFGNVVVNIDQTKYFTPDEKTQGRDNIAAAFSGDIVELNTTISTVSSEITTIIETASADLDDHINNVYNDLSTDINYISGGTDYLSGIIDNISNDIDYLSGSFDELAIYSDIQPGYGLETGTDNTGHKVIGIIQYGCTGGNGGGWDGDNSFALGYNSVAHRGQNPVGFASFAFGARTTADGTDTFAAGDDSHASGRHSVAIGYTNIAQGHYSLAMGSHTSAFSNNSVTIGIGLSGTCQTTLGIYNEAVSNAQFIIGGGRDEGYDVTARKNILLIKDDRVSAADFSAGNVSLSSLGTIVYSANDTNAGRVLDGFYISGGNGITVSATSNNGNNGIYISAAGKTYTQGTGIQISNNNEISITANYVSAVSSTAGQVTATNHMLRFSAINVGVSASNDLLTISASQGKTYQGASGITIDNNNNIGISANYVSASGSQSITIATAFSLPTTLDPDVYYLI